MFVGGHVVDIILALTVAEALLIIRHYRRTGRGLPPSDLLPTLAAGAGLLLALRAALTGADAHIIALWLLVAMVAHLVDLRGRWR